LAPHLYFGNTLKNIEETLKRRNVRTPFPLSETNQERLMHKYQRAIRDTVQLRALGDFNMRKALLREGDA
jgi:hypothetical protein